MNTKSWIVATGSFFSTETIQCHIDSLKYTFNQFKDMTSLKKIAFHALEEQFIELIEYTNMYYNVTKIQSKRFLAIAVTKHTT